MQCTVMMTCQIYAMMSSYNLANNLNGVPNNQCNYLEATPIFNLMTTWFINYYITKSGLNMHDMT